jgi:hypothetical protein
MAQEPFLITRHWAAGFKLMLRLPSQELPNRLRLTAYLSTFLAGRNQHQAACITASDDAITVLPWTDTHVFLPSICPLVSTMCPMRLS